MQTLTPATVARLHTFAPQCRMELERLGELDKTSLPTVAVLGHYNHGKSSLLNALIGKECFAVSDHRETRQTSVQIHHGLQWMDTPGLNADVAGDDDRCAMQAAHHQCDVRLFVHALDMGELDASEVSLLHTLLDEQSATGRQTLLVVTRITNRSSTEREQMLKVIAQQVPDAACIAVSASSHQRGLEHKRPALVRLGNLNELHLFIRKAMFNVDQVRQDERRLIMNTLAQEVNLKMQQARARYQRAKNQKQAAQQTLRDRFATLQHRIESEIR